METEAARSTSPLTVTFQAGRLRRLFVAKFDLGSDDSNKLAALRMCWTHRAEILCTSLDRLTLERLSLTPRAQLPA